MKRLKAALIVIIFLGFASASGYAEEATATSPGTAGMTEETPGLAKEPAALVKEDDRLPIHKQANGSFS